MFRVVSLTGPRQAGKTTLCKLAFPEYRYVSLEDPDMRVYARDDPRAFLNEYRSKVIIDEAQRVPEILSYIQTIVDEDAENGQFILTGSHQLELSQAVSQSLAGRAALLTLLPLSFEELGSAKVSMEQDLLNGFMPGRHAHSIPVPDFYRSYFQTYIERDVRLLVQLKDFVKFENFVRLCAGRVGQLLNQSCLANDVGVSSATIAEWLSVLEASFVIFRLRPYYENFGKRIIKAPKLYFVEPGLAAWLLGIETETQMRRDPLKGNLFENMVVVEALKTLLNRGVDPRLFFFRDSRGNELDLLLQQGRELVPFEIKSAQTWHDSYLKGIRYFQNLAGERCRRGSVVYNGDQTRETERYRLIPYRQLSKFIDPTPA
ncbi:MAG: ATP-binding protein [Gammaproteobacteria bacterium]|nr:ATP-binding protein [Gammaproteobacteria bacterium]